MSCFYLVAQGGQDTRGYLCRVGVTKDGRARWQRYLGGDDAATRREGAGLRLKALVLTKLQRSPEAPGPPRPRGNQQPSGSHAEGGCGGAGAPSGVCGAGAGQGAGLRLAGPRRPPPAHARPVAGRPPGWCLSAQPRDCGATRRSRVPPVGAQGRRAGPCGARGRGAGAAVLWCRGCGRREAAGDNGDYEAAESSG